MTAPSIDIKTRKIWMGALARADAKEVATLFPDLPDHSMLRAPEVGAAMVRGRMGGDGQPFNLGEMTVTRCSVRLGNSMVGHAHVQGRDKAHARRAAVLDALLQSDPEGALYARVIAPLLAAEAAKHAARASKAAATKVEFFTLVRGED